MAVGKRQPKTLLLPVLLVLALFATPLLFTQHAASDVSNGLRGLSGVPLHGLTKTSEMDTHVVSHEFQEAAKGHMHSWLEMALLALVLVGFGLMAVVVVAAPQVA
eukprot:TRINITY_DN29791_c0_g1_i1.p2 TRINITY_DN29791_c0_g1~~TRINITY_DN29791_c0_g1_i1.p2  ORF type:complete len:105 (+),score=25.86 TRINITY_DN29791_c0_g1_i1:105-419(+)